jgi:hypothetical protein
VSTSQRSNFIVFAHKPLHFSVRQSDSSRCSCGRRRRAPHDARLAARHGGLLFEHYLLLAHRADAGMGGRRVRVRARQHCFAGVLAGLLIRASSSSFRRPVAALQLGSERPLSEQDIYDMPPDAQVDVVAADFDCAWADECRAHADAPSMIRVLWNLHGWVSVLGFFYWSCGTAAVIVTPIFMKNLIQYGRRVVIVSRVGIGHCPLTWHPCPSQMSFLSWQICRHVAAAQSAGPRRWHCVGGRALWYRAVRPSIVAPCSPARVHCVVFAC